MSGTIDIIAVCWEGTIINDKRERKNINHKKCVACNLKSHFFNRIISINFNCMSAR